MEKNGLLDCANYARVEALPRALTPQVLAVDCQQVLIRFGYDFLRALAADEVVNIAHLFVRILPFLSPCLPATEWRPGDASNTDLLLASDMDRKNTMFQLICICWAIDDMAAKQGERFQRGSFTIVDPYSRLYNLFADYVKTYAERVNAVNANVGDLKHIIPKFQIGELIKTGTRYFAYQRDPKAKGSSHHVKYVLFCFLLFFFLY